MGLFDTIRRAVGGDDSSTGGDEQAAGDDRSSDDGPELLDTATLDLTTFREYAERVVDGADPLTFDPDALARLDTAIEESYDGKTTGDAAGPTTYTENTVRFGSYLGELLVRAYDGEWTQSDGRWGVTVAGPDDEVTVAVFDVAARSFSDKPVFAAVVTRLKSDLALDTVAETDDDRQESETDENDTNSVVSEPTRVVRRVDDDQADEHADPTESTATDERDEAAATDPADSEPSQAVETDPTRVVRRIESEAEGDDQSDDTDPTPVVSRVAEEPQDEAPSVADLDSGIDGDAGPDATDSASDDDDDGIEPAAAETASEEPTGDSSDVASPADATADQSADDTAGEQSTVETPAEDSSLDSADDGPAVDTTDTVETTAEESAGDPVVDEATTDTDEAATDTDEAATDTDETEPVFDGPTADPSDEAPAFDTPTDESAAEYPDEDRTVDTASEETATDTLADGATVDTSDDASTTDTSDDGTAEESTADEAALDSSPDESSAVAPDAESAPETSADDPPADTADTARIDDTARTDDAAKTDDTPAAVDTAEEGSDTGGTTDSSPDASVPVEDSETTDTSEHVAPPDATDETADTAAADGSEQSDPTDGDGDSTAGTEPNWESGTIRAEYADTAVEFAAFWGEHDLDFSPASLSRLDDLVESQWDDERFAETTFGSDASFDDRAFTSVVRELGGYFGEILVRHLDGEWTDETDHEAAVIVGGSGGQFAVPVFEVAKTSLRKQAVFGRSYDALLDDLGRDGPTR